MRIKMLGEIREVEDWMGQIYCNAGMAKEMPDDKVESVLREAAKRAENRECIQ